MERVDSLLLIWNVSADRITLAMTNVVTVITRAIMLILAAVVTMVTVLTRKHTWS
jgi:hypothetical protein